MNELTETLKMLKVMRTENVVLSSQLKTSMKKIEVVKREYLALKDRMHGSSDKTVGHESNSFRRGSSVGRGLTTATSEGPVLQVFMNASDDEETLERKKNTSLAILDAEIEKSRRSSLREIDVISTSDERKKNVDAVILLAEQEQISRVAAWEDSSVVRNVEVTKSVVDATTEEQARRVAEFQSGSMNEQIEHTRRLSGGFIQGIGENFIPGLFSFQIH
jgi:hypothetical protein